MTRWNTSDDMEKRLDQVSRGLRRRHAGIEPDARFADRVVARLPRGEGWTIAWAARRILPVSIAFAAVLTIVALATARSSEGTAVSASATSPSESDSLDWLLSHDEARR